MSEGIIISPPLEMWAGIECSVNRVGDEFYDQLVRSGHAQRIGDLDLFADLGIRTIRYPVLWERTAPDEPERIDWTWADERLGRLRELGLQPIVGFVHHGSGPRYTSLIDPAFPVRLAEFARQFAARFPWVDSYTPINEPLTTARFSGLYGFWFPHVREELTFARALLAQCRAIVLAMRAVREINLAARLVQTEDLGKTYSTMRLLYQAEFENERRWLTFDLLCGRVRGSHPLRRYFRWVGVPDEELQWFVHNPCPPDLLGINHYLTSERFIDERLDRYPPHTHGSNGRQRYADVEAVRVLAEGPTGPRQLLKEAWDRYRLPLAVTEAHLGCTREEQLRWLQEVWQAAQQARRQGADVRAVTAWALLGTFDWDSLLTQCAGHYEPGVFDVRAPQPRPTALARMAKDLAQTQAHDHPVLDTRGWWRRSERLCYPPMNRTDTRGITMEEEKSFDNVPSPRPLLITGATGTLGGAFARLCNTRGLAHRLLTRQELDIANKDAVNHALDRYEPWAIINTAGYVRVDDAEREVAACMRENADGPATLAAACAARGVKLVTFSSDLVFDGLKQSPYVESDAVNPRNVYGRSKAEAEARVLACLPAALIIRTSAFFGPWDEYNFVINALRTLAAGNVFSAADDAVISPTYVPDLVNVSLDLLIDDESGIWHLANQAALTWAELARWAADRAGIDSGKLDARSMSTLGLIAARPAYSALSSERATLMPSLEDALTRYVNEHRSLFEVGQAAALNRFDKAA
jgi:dTDP-4-dehydrorhamnose reductase